MKKLFTVAICIVLLFGCSLFSTPSKTNGAQVSVEATNKADTCLIETRFLNMLNHNFVYNSDFDCTDTVINNASLALLDMRDAVNEDFIKDTYVKGFIKDMYGIEIYDMSYLNADYPQLDGFVYIIPRGYTSYNHTIVSVKENEDGSYTVVSDVTINNHDTASKTEKAVSLFVKNDSSAFGYNMIYCNIISDSADI